MTALLLKLAFYASALVGAGLALAAVAIVPSRPGAARVLRVAAAFALGGLVIALFGVAIDTARLAGGWASIADPPYLGWTLDAQAPFLALLGAGGAMIAAGSSWPA